MAGAGDMRRGIASRGRRHPFAVRLAQSADGPGSTLGLGRGSAGRLPRPSRAARRRGPVRAVGRLRPHGGAPTWPRHLLALCPPAGPGAARECSPRGGRVDRRCGTERGATRGGVCELRCPPAPGVLARVAAPRTRPRAGGPGACAGGPGNHRSRPGAAGTRLQGRGRSSAGPRVCRWPALASTGPHWPASAAHTGGPPGSVERRRLAPIFLAGGSTSQARLKQYGAPTFPPVGRRTHRQRLTWQA